MTRIGHRARHSQVEIKDIKLASKYWHIRQQVVPLKTVEIPTPRGLVLKDTVDK